MKYPALPITPRDPRESFSLPQLGTLTDFWQWACSDLCGNTLRGVLAEYLVTKALGSDSAVRTEWDAFDVLCRSDAGVEIKVEVKTSAYVQSWPQAKLSVPRFDIAKKRAWDAGTNVMSETAIRSADVYVFCLHHHKEQASVNPMDVSQWSFFVVPTPKIEAMHGEGKSLGLSAVAALAGSACGLDELRSRVFSALA